MQYRVMVSGTRPAVGGTITTDDLGVAKAFFESMRSALSNGELLLVNEHDQVICSTEKNAEPKVSIQIRSTHIYDLRGRQLPFAL